MKLPAVREKELGKVGPAFGIGAGCGLGFGIGLIGGTGFGPGLPGLHLGFGLGACCGVGLGYGYGIGRGVAYDDNRKHSNVGKLFTGQTALAIQQTALSIQNAVGGVSDAVISTKKLIQAIFKEIEKRGKP